MTRAHISDVAIAIATTSMRTLAHLNVHCAASQGGSPDREFSFPQVCATEFAGTLVTEFGEQPKEVKGAFSDLSLDVVAR